jgi:hypothetical protein
VARNEITASILSSTHTSHVEQYGQLSVCFDIVTGVDCQEIPTIPDIQDDWCFRYDLRDSPDPESREHQLKVIH